MDTLVDASAADYFGNIKAKEEISHNELILSLPLSFHLQCNTHTFIYPFPSYDNSAADDFERILSKH